VRPERLVGARLDFYEGLAHLGAHLEGIGPDRGTHPREHFGTGGSQRAHGVLDHARGKAAPARMRDRHARAGAIAQEERHAVRGEHDAHATGDRCRGGVRARALGASMGIEVDDVCGVDLGEPRGIGRQQRAHDRAVCGPRRRANRRWIVPGSCSRTRRS
jgi:hypothetical protein